MADTIESLETQLIQMQERLLTMRAERRASVLAKIKELAMEEGLTGADLAAAMRPTRAARNTAGDVAPKTNPGRRAVVAPKFKHPETGATWAGRGKAPAWLKALEEAGRLEEARL